MKKKSLFYFFIVYLAQLDAYIYYATVLRKWDPSRHRFHYVIGLGDFHCKHHSANGKHKQELIDVLAEIQPSRMRILTEDLSVANDLGRKGARGFSVNSRGGFLGGLTDIFREMGIEAHNLEYRYARVCSLGPILNNPESDPIYLEPAQKILVADLKDEIRLEIDRIRSYEDGPVIDEWYRTGILDIEKKSESLKRSADAVSVASFLKNCKGAKMAIVRKLLTFDAPLLDMKIVHEIVGHPEVPYTCVIAGGSHIERAEELLDKIGYQRIYRAYSQELADAAIDVCSYRDRAIHLHRPKPLSLLELRRFFYHDITF